MNGVVWCNMHSRSHPEEVAKYCLKSIQCGKNCGDLYNAGLSYGPLMWNLQVQGANLVAIEEYARECLQFSQKYHLFFSVGLAEAMQAGWIEPMKKGYTPIPMKEKIEKWENDNHIASAGSYYVHMALTHYYFGEFEQAEHYLQGVNRYLTGMTDNILKRQWHVFQVLNAIRLYVRGKVYKSCEELLSFIQPLNKKVEIWAQYGPMFKPYLAFIYAELERFTGDSRKARSLYFDAIATARKERFTLLEGHLNECRGELLKETGVGTAGVYFAEAARLYKKCHAERKEILLIEKYQEYFEEEAAAHAPAEAEAAAYILPGLDADYLTKSSLAISAEIDSEVLLKKIMNVVLESSGAQHGYLLTEESGSLIVSAESHIAQKDAVRTVKYNLEDSADICKEIIRYVHRTKEMVILNNASEEGQFKDNPKVQRLRLKSVLCLPLIKQSELIGILYLENRLSDSVFTTEKTKITELLASQAAISLENARLLDETKRTGQALRASEERLAGLIASVSDYMTMVDDQFTVVWTNDVAKDMFGPDLIGQKCYSFFRRQDSICKGCVTKRCFEDGKVHRGETEIVGDDGKKQIFLKTASVAARREDGRPKMVLEVFHNITDLKQAENRIKTSLEEKEMLLKEIHHRVTNNLQIISSLLRLGSRYIKDQRKLQILKKSQDQIKSMALVHKKLYQSKDLTKVDFTAYTRSLTTELFRSYGVASNTVALKVDVGNILLGVDMAIPCGLILNELISNSIKYAFPYGKKGEIHVGLYSDNSRLTLMVCDNGVGFPKEIDFRNSETLGLQLATTLVKQLKGTIELDSSPRRSGTEFKIVFSILGQGSGVRIRGLED